MRVVRWGLLIAAAGALVVAPHIVSPYVLRILISIIITTLPVASLTLLLGLGGQISMGQAAFSGIGAYAYADLTLKLHWSPWIAMAGGVAMAYVIAWCIGRPILRLRGYYLGMGTLAIGLIASAFFNSVDKLTGGFSGISAIPAPSVFGLKLDSPERIYFYSLIVVALVFVALKRLGSGDYGRRLRTMKESELAARAYGIDVSALKAQVFAIASATAALGGCLYAQYVSFISPESFTINSSINYMLAAVVGGLGSIWGGVLGSVYVVLLPEALQSYGTYELLISGIVIVVVVGIVPGGIIEAGQLASSWLQRMGTRWGTR
jgi:branched-chain amino acid transport system permease protein